MKLAKIPRALTGNMACMKPGRGYRMVVCKDKFSCLDHLIPFGRSQIALWAEAQSSADRPVGALTKKRAGGQMRARLNRLPY